MAFQNNYYYPYNGPPDDEYEDEKESVQNARYNDGSDEGNADTEEASETDNNGPNEEPLEIKEQMYQDKLSKLKKQLSQLKDGSLPEFKKKMRRLEFQYKERLRINVIYREYLMECVEREYMLEKKASVKEFEEKKVDLRDNLLSEYEEKRRIIETERHSMELIGETNEVKPVMTRKLRRRPNDPMPVQEKRRKPPASQVVFLLDEKDVDNDLKAITSRKILTPTIRKHSQLGALSQSGLNMSGLNLESSSSSVDARIEDGKLLYERRWFHRGQPVYVEGKDMPRFAANISAISSDAICVKKSSDGSKVRIYLAQLSKGKIYIKRRAS